MSQDKRHRPGAPNDAAVGWFSVPVRFMMCAKHVETDQAAVEHLHLTFAPTKSLI
jgi:hypothetical protein